MSNAISCLLSGLPESAGGMRISSSSVSSRRRTSLCSGLPGAIAGLPSRSAVALSTRSKRNSAWSWSLSGPWQAKHLSARIGRMSRLNCTGSAAVAIPQSSISAAVIVVEVQWRGIDGGSQTRSCMLLPNSRLHRHCAILKRRQRVTGRVCRDRLPEDLHLLPDRWSARRLRLPRRCKNHPCLPLVGPRPCGAGRPEPAHGPSRNGTSRNGTSRNGTSRNRTVDAQRPTKGQGWPAGNASVRSGDVSRGGQSGGRTIARKAHPASRFSCHPHNCARSS